MSNITLPITSHTNTTKTTTVKDDKKMLKKFLFFYIAACSIGTSFFLLTLAYCLRKKRKKHELAELATNAEISMTIKKQ
ncbi:MAG: hypothetical protein AAF770_03180 [Bacteroidota bacterium]